MGSLDDATSDNTTQETTLATIRSVSGDWDNNNVTTVPNVSSFASNGTFIAPAKCSVVKITAIGGGGGGSDANGTNGENYVGGGGSGGSVLYMEELSGAGAHLHINIGAGGAGGSNHAVGSAGGDTWIKKSNTPILTAHGGAGASKGTANNSLYGGAGGPAITAPNGYSSDAALGSNIKFVGGTGRSGVGASGNAQLVTEDGAPMGGIASFLGGHSCYGSAQIGQGGVGGSSSTNAGAGGNGIVLIEW